MWIVLAFTVLVYVQLEKTPSRYFKRIYFVFPMAENQLQLSAPCSVSLGACGSPASLTVHSCTVDPHPYNIEIAFMCPHGESGQVPLVLVMTDEL